MNQSLETKLNTKQEESINGFEMKINSRFDKIIALITSLETKVKTSLINKMKSSRRIKHN